LNINAILWLFILNLDFGIYIRHNTSSFPCSVKNVGNDEASGMAGR